MIKKFEEYQSLNEDIRKNTAMVLLNIALLFNSIKRDNPVRYNMDYFQKYVKTLNVANNDYVYRRVLQEAKRKVMSDPRINNKSEVIKKMDSLIVIYKGNDEFINLLYKEIDRGKKNTRTSSMVIKNQIMILNKDARPEEIYHELMHVAYDISNSKEEIVKLFNFNNTSEKQIDIINKMTNDEWNIRPTTDTVFIEYLKQPTEIYARLNEFKFFLFRTKIIKTPYEKLNPKMIYNLINGKIYEGLNKNEKDKFGNCHFIELFKFLDLSKLEHIQ